jgi:flagellar M-ring protein FliF
MNLLTKDINSDQNGEVSSETISKQQSAEKAYEDKLQNAVVSILEPIVGKDKVKATVNADLDFDSKQKTQTVVDPNKVIVSQENDKESNAAGTGTASQSPVDNNMSNQITNGTTNNSTSSKENQKTNYEVGKSESKVISAPGEVKRLTASVIIDGNLDAQTQQTLENAVSNAIGYDANRGDKVSVVGMAFDTSAQDAAKAEIDTMNAQVAADSKNKMMIIAGILGTIVLAVLIVGIIILSRRRRKQKAEEAQLLDTLIDDTIIPKELESFEPIEFEAKNKKSHLEDEIKKYATEKPEQVVEIIRSWLAENERG